jgi:hypothetical protein
MVVNYQTGQRLDFEAFLKNMSIQSILRILSENDGSLPDIEFDFGLEKCVATAYQIIQNQSSYIDSLKPYYWSRLREIEVPIIFGQNPAEILLTGDAEPFHLVFGGIISLSGKSVPDLGVFVLCETVISLDYRMGEYWNEQSIEGLFEIMSRLKFLSCNTNIKHLGNFFDYEETILLSAFNDWQADNKFIYETTINSPPST